MSKIDVLHEKIIELSKELYREKRKEQKDFEEGDRINYAGRVYDEEEIENLVDASLEFWLTAGKYANKFEKDLGSFLGQKYCALVNTGSSSNLLAFMTLTSPLLGDRRIFPGDEVITVAAGFPTTISPIIQYGAVPVFVDVTIPQYNIDCSLLEDALSDKTKAVMLAHTLGNPFDLAKVKKFCKRHELWLIEDNCDSLGSEYFLDGIWKYTGTFGDIGTSSFYPPHHITMGEGGALYTNDPILNRVMVSMRDWGRDCICPSGRDNFCGRRFEGKYGELPAGYDHKYVYSHFGYNLKATDLQAAIGCAQLKKLPSFIDARRNNWDKLRLLLAEFEDVFILPQAAENAKPSWFGLLLTIRKQSCFKRDEIIRFIEQKNIQTRLLFAGNIIKHPCFDEMRQNKKGYRVVGELNNTDIIMNDTFWIGVYPGINDKMIEYMYDQIKAFIKR